MRSGSTSVFILSLGLALGACGESNEPVNENPNDSTPRATGRPATFLPLLRDGTHVSVIRGFNPPDSNVDPILEERLQDAVDAGMKSVRIQMDWADFEPSPGVYSSEDLDERLDDFEAQGLQVLMSAYAIDSSGPVMPEDLQNRVLAGERIDSEEVLGRYTRFLRWLAAELRGRDVWGLLITNEPGPWFDDDGRDSTEYVNFYRESVAAVHAVHPELAVSATHTKSEATVTPEKFHAATMRELDFASFNYYAGTIDFTTTGNPTGDTGTGRAAVLKAFEELQAASDGKQFIVQELGAPAGYTDQPSTIGASPETQREFYENAIAVAGELDRARAVYSFQLVDWSEFLLDGQRALLEGVDSGFVEAYIESLGTIGLVTEAGEERPAWQEFLDGVRDQR